MNKKYDNKNTRRGHGGRFGKWSYEGQMMIRLTRMRLEVVAKTRGEITQIVSMIRIIEIREEEEEGKELAEEASVEIVSIAMKKGIEHLNILSAKEGMIEEMNGRVEPQLRMKIKVITF